MLRKRRRQILEEEEDISEEDYNDALKKDKFMPDMATYTSFFFGKKYSALYIVYKCNIHMSLE